MIGTSIFRPQYVRKPPPPRLATDRRARRFTERRPAASILSAFCINAWILNVIREARSAEPAG